MSVLAVAAGDGLDIGGVHGLHADDMVACIHMQVFARGAGAEVGEQVERGLADLFLRDIAAERGVQLVPLHDVAEIADAAGGQRLDRAVGQPVEQLALGRLESQRMGFVQQPLDTAGVVAQLPLDHLLHTSAR